MVTEINPSPSLAATKLIDCQPVDPVPYIIVYTVTVCYLTIECWKWKRQNCHIILTRQ